eukprot:jgi/Botrbrau1/11197/Bobra.0214s0021.2
MGYTLFLTFGAFKICCFSCIAASVLAERGWQWTSVTFSADVSCPRAAGVWQWTSATFGRQMLHVAGQQVDVNALCKSSLVDPKLVDLVKLLHLLQEDELDDFLNFEAIIISESRSTTTMRKSM